MQNASGKKLRRFQFNETGWWTEDQLRKRDEKFFAEIEEYNRSLPELRRAYREKWDRRWELVCFLATLTGVLWVVAISVKIWEWVM